MTFSFFLIITIDLNTDFKKDMHNLIMENIYWAQNKRDDIITYHVTTSQ